MICYLWYILELQHRLPDIPDDKERQTEEDAQSHEMKPCRGDGVTIEDTQLVYHVIMS